MSPRQAFLIIQHLLPQQDALITEAEASHYFAHGVPGSLSDFVVAGSEDEDPPGGGCGASEDSGLPPSTPGKQWLCPTPGRVAFRSRWSHMNRELGTRLWVEDKPPVCVAEIPNLPSESAAHHW